MSSGANNCLLLKYPEWELARGIVIYNFLPFTLICDGLEIQWYQMYFTFCLLFHYALFIPQNITPKQPNPSDLARWKTEMDCSGEPRHVVCELYKTQAKVWASQIYSASLVQQHLQTFCTATECLLLQVMTFSVKSALCTSKVMIKRSYRGNLHLILTWICIFFHSDFHLHFLLLLHKLWRKAELEDFSSTHASLVRESDARYYLGTATMWQSQGNLHLKVNKRSSVPVETLTTGAGMAFCSYHFNGNKQEEMQSGDVHVSLATSWYQSTDVIQRIWLPSNSYGGDMCV